MQNAANTPGGFSDNRYVKTSEYQFIKIFRTIIYLLGVGVRAIITLIADVIKGITGKS